MVDFEVFYYFQPFFYIHYNSNLKQHVHKVISLSGKSTRIVYSLQQPFHIPLTWTLNPFLLQFSQPKHSATLSSFLPQATFPSCFSPPALSTCLPSPSPSHASKAFTLHLMPGTRSGLARERGVGKRKGLTPFALGLPKPRQVKGKEGMRPLAEHVVGLLRRENQWTPVKRTSNRRIWVYF